MRSKGKVTGSAFVNILTLIRNICYIHSKIMNLEFVRIQRQTMKPLFI